MSRARDEGMTHRSLRSLALSLLALLAGAARAQTPAALPDDPACTAADRRFMERAYELARFATTHGGAPFGAVLVKDGVVIAEYSNSEFSTGDVTKHAETGLISAFSPKLSRATFAASTLYTSSEPCAMCCGSIRFAGIRRVVYGTTETQFLRVLGVPPDPNPLESREVFARTAPKVQVLGPLMEAEGLAIHEAYWPNHKGTRTAPEDALLGAGPRSESLTRHRASECL
jgi:tRNA(Arg) A34 adenosine deaminase TadA